MAVLIHDHPGSAPVAVGLERCADHGADVLLDGAYFEAFGADVGLVASDGDDLWVGEDGLRGAKIISDIPNSRLSLGEPSPLRADPRRGRDRAAHAWAEARAEDDHGAGRGATLAGDSGRPDGIRFVEPGPRRTDVQITRSGVQTMEGPRAR